MMSGLAAFNHARLCLGSDDALPFVGLTHPLAVRLLALFVGRKQSAQPVVRVIDLLHRDRHNGEVKFARRLLLPTERTRGLCRAISVRVCSAIAHPTTRRERASSSTARESQLSCIAMGVISPIQWCFGTGNRREPGSRGVAPSYALGRSSSAAAAKQPNATMSSATRA